MRRTRTVHRLAGGVMVSAALLWVGGCGWKRDHPGDPGGVNYTRPDAGKPDHGVSDHGVSDQRVSDRRVSDRRVSDRRVSDQRVSDQRVSDQRVSDQRVLDQGVGIPGTWVTLKAGTFQMGSPATESCRVLDETRHSVTLTSRIVIQSTEVTQDQFWSVMHYRPSFFSACGTCPVETVNWHEAAAYGNALSARAKLTPCYTCSGSGASVTCQEATGYRGRAVYKCPGYRLPTEAEWERAYRAGMSTAFYNGGITVCWGRKDPNAEKIGWYRYNSGKKTHSVGRKAANAWGLYDMAGNVWEWCEDWYVKGLGSSSVTNPVGLSGSTRVLRGGSWPSDARYVRAALRYDISPSTRFDALGFRLVRSAP